MNKYKYITKLLPNVYIQIYVKVLHLANPVTDSENGSVILDAFSKQLIVDLSSDILSDPNYEPAKFPSLTMMLVDL